MQLLPQELAGISSTELRDQLNEFGYKIQKQQINKDLKMLSNTIPIKCNYAGAGETSERG